MNLHERGKVRRKQRILDAVIEIVDAEGVAGLTTSRVSEHAEVSVKTIYNLIGSLDEILDELSQTLFSSLAEQLRTRDQSQDVKTFFDEFIDKSHQFLQCDEKRNRAALTAILHANNVSGGSYRDIPIAGEQFKFMAKGIRLFQKQGYLRSAVNVQLLAEQMLFADAMLLELWTTKRIDLERYELTYKYHVWTLIRAWAEVSFIGHCDRSILELQKKLMLLESLPKTPSELEGMGNE